MEAIGIDVNIRVSIITIGFLHCKGCFQGSSKELVEDSYYKYLISWIRLQGVVK